MNSSDRSHCPPSEGNRVKARRPCRAPLELNALSSLGGNRVKDGNEADDGTGIKKGRRGIARADEQEA